MPRIFSTVVFLLAGCLGLQATGHAGGESRCPDGEADAQVAARLGLDLERLAKLRAVRDLDNHDLCVMPAKDLTRAIHRIDHPKPDHPGQWAEFRARQQSVRGQVKPDGLIQALAQRQRLLTGPAPQFAGLGRAAWRPLGPDNIGGRVRALWIHPDDPQHLLAGSVSGGIWRSLDGGGQWLPVQDFMGNLSISSIVSHPGRPAVIYAGTGEGYYNGDAVRGHGVFKSEDGGRSWRHLPGTDPSALEDWYYVNRLAIHPSRGQVLLAATRGSLRRSTDGGATWRGVARYTGAFSCGYCQVLFDPRDGAKAIAARGDGRIAYSRDGGQTWHLRTLRQGAGRVELAYAPSTPDLVYASLDMNGGQVYRSQDGGDTWERLSTPGHLSSQGWYDNVIWVDPVDANILVVGGINLHRSLDGGQSWRRISTWWLSPDSPHADHHVIVASPRYDGVNDKTVYVGNDGGVYRTSDIRTARAGSTDNGWSARLGGLAVTQFYDGAGRAANGGAIYGGTQDNGTLGRLLDSPSWATVYGGDGGAAAVDSESDAISYGEYVYLSLHRSLDRGASVQYICRGITEAGSWGCGGSDEANFIAPFALDPNDNQRLLAGAKSLWLSEDAKAASPGWRIIKAATGNDYWSYISAIAVTPGNGDIVWVGHNNGEIWRSDDARSPSPSWTRVREADYRMVLRLFIDPDRPRLVYAGLGGYEAGGLIRSGDNGATWRTLGSELPAAPVRAITRHPRQTQWLYLGNEVGVYTSLDGGLTWSTGNDGPANVAVDNLFWYDDATLVAVTHGRGMFAADIVERVDPSPDFDGDGRPDLIWRRNDSGDNRVWLMDGAERRAVRTLPVLAAPWRLGGSGDFNRDGQPDLVWHDPGNGQLRFWYMTGTNRLGEAELAGLAAPWRLAGVGDFNGDGQPDLLWRDPGSGENRIWHLNGANLLDSATPPALAAPWQVAGIADLDGDLRPDIVWRDPLSGNNRVWYMRDARRLGSRALPALDAAWQPGGLTDLDGDGRPDLLWRRPDNGANQVWLLKGAERVASLPLPALAGTWQLGGGDEQ